MNLPYRITVNVIKGNLLLSAPTAYKRQCWAIMTPDGREAVITPRSPQGMHPGVMRDGWVLRELDFIPHNA